MKAVCVYCGSSDGRLPEYGQAGAALGRELAARRLTLVYGGGNVGIMRRVADAALEAGGRVIGVIPEHLVGWERAHRDVTELHVVKSMHERKALMVALSDAFIAMPGGFGTLDELFEALTWGQLRLHRKPCAMLNVAGYFDSLVAMLARARQDGFLYDEGAEPIVDTDAARVIERLAGAAIRASAGASLSTSAVPSQ
jgi:uncharacterized protein (TIGR00730 family)